MAAVDASTGTEQAEGPLVLKPKLDLTESEAILVALMKRRGADVQIDASGVEQVGAHALQTLLVAFQSWKADGKSFAVTGWPEGAVEQLAVLGIDQGMLTSERTTA